MEFLPGLLIAVPFIFWLWRADRRFDDAQKAWRLERVGLLNRIAAPGTIPPEDAPEPSGEKLYVSPDDDEAHDDYLEARAAGQVS